MLTKIKQKGTSRNKMFLFVNLYRHTGFNLLAYMVHSTPLSKNRIHRIRKLERFYMN